MAFALVVTLTLLLSAATVRAVGELEPDTTQGLLLVGYAGGRHARRLKVRNEELARPLQHLPSAAN